MSKDRRISSLIQNEAFEDKGYESSTSETFGCKRRASSKKIRKKKNRTQEIPDNLLNPAIISELVSTKDNQSNIGDTIDVEKTNKSTIEDYSFLDSFHRPDNDNDGLSRDWQVAFLTLAYRVPFYYHDVIEDKSGRLGALLADHTDEKQEMQIKTQLETRCTLEDVQLLPLSDLWLVTKQCFAVWLRFAMMGMAHSSISYSLLRLENKADVSPFDLDLSYTKAFQEIIFILRQFRKWKLNSLNNGILIEKIEECVAVLNMTRNSINGFQFQKRIFSGECQTSVHDHLKFLFNHGYDSIHHGNYELATSMPSRFTGGKTAYHVLSLRLQARLHEMGMRILNGDLYEPIYYESNGIRVFTHSYKQNPEYATIIDFINIKTESNNYPYDWHLLNMVGNTRKRLIDSFTEEIFECVPHYEPYRFCFAFRNGLYFIDTCEFMIFNSNSLPSNIVAMRFFDTDYDLTLFKLSKNVTDLLNSRRQNLLYYRKRTDESIRDCSFKVSRSYINKMLERPVVNNGIVFNPESNQDNTPRGQELYGRYLERQLCEHGRASPTDWRNIRVESMETILNYQGFDEDTKDWIYAFLGRMLYPCDFWERWQVCFFIEGAAQTGKSSIIQLVQSFYKSKDVSILSSNIETGFGLGVLYGRCACFCPEFKKGFKLEVSELLQIISAETLSAAKKFKNPIEAKWDQHILMVGNELEGVITDIQNSLLRRLIVIEMPNTVINDFNSHLIDDDKNNIHILLTKCNLAYLEKVALFGTSRIQDVLPPYFERQMNKVRAGMHALEDFIQNSEDVLSIDSAVSIPLSRLKQLYNCFCNREGLTAEKLTSTTSIGIFKRHGLKIDIRSGIIYGIGEKVKLC